MKDLLICLPALPASWQEGEVQELKARGSYTIDFSWKNGKVIDYKIASPTRRFVKVLINGQLEEKQL